MVNKFNIESANAPGVRRLRSITSQIVACMSPNLLLLDLGMAISFTTIALPDLLNATEGLSLDENQASWFGSIAFIVQPIGALVSGPMVDYCGRKKANFLANIPHVCAWILMYFSWNLTSLFLANILLGLGTGVMEAPINSYVGEISEPTMRGALCSFTQFFLTIGVFVMYFLPTLVDWRRAALICLIAPACSMLLVLLVPESPIWLLVKGREKEALRSLCYLRGWTTPENVREEYDDLVVYSDLLQQCVICHKTNDKTPSDCEHYKMNFFKRFLLKIRCVMLCKETLRPLSMVILYFAFLMMSGYVPIRPNMVNVCGAFGMAVDGKSVVFMVGVLMLITTFILVGLIKIFGKRKLALFSMLGAALSCAGLSVYAKTYLEDSVFSYDPTTFPETKSYVPLVLFYLLVIFNGFTSVPWVLLGEVFSFRSRASAQGITAAFVYVITFIASKTFISMEISLHLWGTYAVYAALAFFGAIYLYFFLPETEGKSLLEIESYYNGKRKIFANDPFINFFKRFKR